MGTVAAVQKAPAGPRHVETRPAAAAGKPESRAEGEEALQNAVAAAVVAAMTEQFANRVISVKLDSAEIEIASLRDRVVSGVGRLQIGLDEDWIGFRYRTLYDRRYLRIDAQGIADFGREGSTPAHVDALYDRREKTWLRVSYALGPSVGLRTGDHVAGQ